ncbi:MAG: ABC transporter ATP-binding protein/permease [Ruminococcaceae bacterium]|nr:ABC transporter ATP-binding protein/permease [Oscillospiraceae bacterium]
MLELKHICKSYPAGDGAVEALKGIDLRFRESEFVSILGPSGCGKTTMLNIIGGLDQYTSGDLIINGRSTKDFRDRDWDTYRNHSVGFVFQSYNLIPHQTVLQNVELALTLSGVSKAERRKRAKAALEEVGLSSQLNKRPAEMSGGQMQRVAIARALVNNPDIILADEPTGALDTETSIQVMDILKVISAKRLVVMVTHNPNLAETYSTRIIRMIDGRITGDSMPLTEQEIDSERIREQEKRELAKKSKKPSMSFATSFGLSLKNLFTKKGRTLLTAFAGSIGIIGIALIFAVSHGMTSYIDTVQEDTLASYPLSLESSHMDLGTLLQTFIGAAQNTEQHEKDAVYQKSVVYDLINSLNDLEADENDLKSFKAYLEKKLSEEGGDTALREAVNGVQYQYSTDLLVYTENVDGTIIASDTRELLGELIAEHMGMQMAASMQNNGMQASGGMTAMMGGGGMQLWQEILPGLDGDPINPLLKKQYDLVYGTWPNSHDEIVLVLDSNNELDDMTLYALGLKSKEEIDAVMRAATDRKDVAYESKSWSYEEICGMEFRVILSADCYTLDETSGLYTDLRDSETGLKYLYANGIPLKVTGILRPSEDAVSSMLTGSIGYTHLLTKQIIEKAESSAAVKAQLADPDTDIFTGLPFKESAGEMTDAEKESEFRAFVEKLDNKGKADTYIRIMSIPTKEQLDGAVSQAMSQMTRESMEQTLLQIMTEQTGMNESEIRSYIESMSDEDLTDIFTDMVTEQVKRQFAAQVEAQMSAMSDEQLAAALTMAISTYTPEQFALYHDEILTFSDSTYEENLLRLGHLDLDDPTAINLYASSFAGKDVIEEAISAYNDGVDEISRISYTDYVGLMMSSITSVINAITYVLISFVAISLVVSSIMIGVITLISVQERTKEIGILRAIGASKKDVSGMFNAETVIIGFTSGLLGVIITYLLCFPINAIIHHLTGLPNLNAVLPFEVAAILVAISVALTLFSGIIPSRSAAKKDPVVALRTE